MRKQELGETLPVRVAIHRIGLARGEGSLSEVTSSGYLGDTRAPWTILQEAAELGQGPERGLSGASVLGLPHGALGSSGYDTVRWGGVCVTTTRWKEAAGILQSSERVLSHAVLRCPRLTASVPTGLPRRPGGLAWTLTGGGLAHAFQEDTCPEKVAKSKAIFQEKQKAKNPSSSKCAKHHPHRWTNEPQEYVVRGSAAGSSVETQSSAGARGVALPLPGTASMIFISAWNTKCVLILILIKAESLAPSAMATIKMADAFHQLYLNFALMGIQRLWVHLKKKKKKGH